MRWKLLQLGSAWLVSQADWYRSALFKLHLDFHINLKACVVLLPSETTGTVNIPSHDDLWLTEQIFLSWFLNANFILKQDYLLPDAFFGILSNSSKQKGNEIHPKIVFSRLFFEILMSIVIVNWHSENEITFWLIIIPSFNLYWKISWMCKF